MPATIYFHPEAYSTKGPKLMGRNAAGESFLRGLLTYSKTDTWCVQVQEHVHAKYFVQAARTFGRNESVDVVDNNTLGALSKVGTVYHPGPGIGPHAFQRAAHGHGAWSLCGITHTTSSALAMDGLADLIIAPVQPWDAVICTSNAVKDNVTRLLQAQKDYLTERLGLSKLVLPQLPVIPLGIHTQDYVYTDKQKTVARTALGVDANTLVVLYMGRLSFHGKAHPLAMYQALELAVTQNKFNVLLIECGWHANDSIENAFAEAAQLACPNVRVLTLDGRNAEDRLKAWASADVFCSLSDNIQETFGITPIEAMAAGLPVVVSDWDGYKDTVRDGIDGFRIPTTMPGLGLGADLAQRHAMGQDSYDRYCGYTCSLVAVDIEVASQAFTKLFESAELRRTMGAAGRARARAVYDWAVVIAQYEELWAELDHLRRSQAPLLKHLDHPWPARMDPFHAFASYPTHILTLQTRLSLVDVNARIGAARLEQYRTLLMVNFAELVLPHADEILLVLVVAEQGEKTANELLQTIEPARKPFVFRALAWMIKLGVLRTIL